MAILKPNIPFPTSEPFLIVENKLAPGKHSFELVVIDSINQRSMPATGIVTIQEGPTVPGLPPIVKPPIILGPDPPPIVKPPIIGPDPPPIFKPPIIGPDLPPIVKPPIIAGPALPPIVKSGAPVLGKQLAMKSKATKSKTKTTTSKATKKKTTTKKPATHTASKKKKPS